MTYGEHLKQMRIAHGYSIKGLAEEIHISRQTVSRWEKDESLPDVTELQLMSTLYKTEVSRLTPNATNQPNEKQEDTEEIDKMTAAKFFDFFKVTVKENGREVRRLHPVVKTGLTAFCISAFALLTVAVFVYVFLPIIDPEAFGFITYITPIMVGIVLLVAIVLALPTGIAMFIRMGMEKKKKK